MAKTRAKGFFAFLIFCILPVILFSAPTKESLIKAWENQQKTDPNTLAFEEISHNFYRFKTERFPFDGELKILNVTVDEQMSGFEGGFTMGIVEIELIDLPDDFLKKYAYSYSTWSQSNILYYDKENETWLSTKDYYTKAQENLPSGIFIDPFNYIPLLFLFFLIIILIFVYNIQKRNRKYLDFVRELSQKETDLAEKACKLSKQSNKILKDILKELKKTSKKKKK
jgi:hypothetical protein